MRPLVEHTIVCHMAGSHDKVIYTERVRTWPGVYWTVLDRIEALYEELQPDLEWEDIEVYDGDIPVLWCDWDGDDRIIQSARQAWIRLTHPPDRE